MGPTLGWILARAPRQTKHLPGCWRSRGAGISSQGENFPEQGDSFPPEVGTGSWRCSGAGSCRSAPPARRPLDPALPSDQETDRILAQQRFPTLASKPKIRMKEEWYGIPGVQ